MENVLRKPIKYRYGSLRDGHVPRRPRTLEHDEQEAPSEKPDADDLLANGILFLPTLHKSDLHKKDSAASNTAPNAGDPNGDLLDTNLVGNSQLSVLDSNTEDPASSKFTSTGFILVTEDDASESSSVSERGSEPELLLLTTADAAHLRRQEIKPHGKNNKGDNRSTRFSVHRSDLDSVTPSPAYSNESEPDDLAVQGNGFGDRPSESETGHVNHVAVPAQQRKDSTRSGIRIRRGDILCLILVGMAVASGLLLGSLTSSTPSKDRASVAPMAPNFTIQHFMDAEPKVISQSIVDLSAEFQCDNYAQKLARARSFANEENIADGFGTHHRELDIIRCHELKMMSFEFDDISHNEYVRFPPALTTAWTIIHRVHVETQKMLFPMATHPLKRTKLKQRRAPRRIRPANLLAHIKDLVAGLEFYDEALNRLEREGRSRTELINLLLELACNQPPAEPLWAWKRATNPQLHDYPGIQRACGIARIAQQDNARLLSTVVHGDAGTVHRLRETVEDVRSRLSRANRAGKNNEEFTGQICAEVVEVANMALEEMGKFTDPHEAVP